MRAYNIYLFNKFWKAEAMRGFFFFIINRAHIKNEIGDESTIKLSLSIICQKLACAPSDSDSMGVHPSLENPSG